jgi:hypothetical protein
MLSLEAVKIERPGLPNFYKINDGLYRVTVQGGPEEAVVALRTAAIMYATVHKTRGKNVAVGRATSVTS